MKESPYRRHARAVIAAAIERMRDAPLATIKRVLTQVYPFDARTGWAYQCWLRERKDALYALERSRGETPGRKVASRTGAGLMLIKPSGALSGRAIHSQRPRSPTGIASAQTSLSMRLEHA